MTTKVKILYGSSEESLEKRINEFVLQDAILDWEIKQVFPTNYYSWDGEDRRDVVSTYLVAVIKYQEEGGKGVRA